MVSAGSNATSPSPSISERIPSISLYKPVLALSACIIAPVLTVAVTVSLPAPVSTKVCSSIRVFVSSA